ncbi:MAG: hypothetical protein JWM65_3596 [Sphingomonas bacterium]|nr:hypothetical protein [Sphingomonas bacterium]
MLIPRLVLGCGHLTGGASTVESRKLLEHARAAGIGHFDTAPSYGIGTAEDVVGQLLGNDPEVAITAKIGSLRPGAPLLKTVARRALRLVRGGPRTPPPYNPSLPGENHAADGCFDPTFMAESFDITAKKLRRTPIEHVLLHESHAAPPAPHVIAFLDRLLAEGRAGRVGFANSAVYDPALRAACPAHWTVQAAIDPAMLLTPVALPDAPTILHTLVKTDAWMRAHDPLYAAAGARVLDTFAAIAPRATLAVLLPYYLVARNVPAAKLIYTSSVLERLDAVLTATREIDRVGAAEEITGTFDGAYRSAEIGDAGTL